MPRSAGSAGWTAEGGSGGVGRAGPNEVDAQRMRAAVLSGKGGRTWQAGPRSAAELREAATHFDRAAALQPAPEVKAALADGAAFCRSQADVM